MDNSNFCQQTDSALSVTVHGIEPRHAMGMGVVSIFFISMGYFFEGSPLAWVGGVILFVAVCGCLRDIEDRKVVASALRNGVWMKAQLSSGFFSTEACWEIKETYQSQDRPGRTWWTRYYSGALSGAQGLEVLVCDTGCMGLVVRHGQDVFLVTVDERHPPRNFLQEFK